MAHIITLLTVPLLTRIYSPSAFGTASIFIAVTGILSSVSCLRYEQTIPLPYSEQVAIRLLFMCVAIIFISSIFLSLIFNFLDLNQLLPEIAPFKWFIPFAVFIGGAELALKLWYARINNFKIISQGAILNVVVTSIIGVGICGYWLQLSNTGLIISGLVGQSVLSLYLFVNLFVGNKKITFKTFSFKMLYLLSIKYKKFPIFGCFSILLGNCAWLLPVILMGVYFSPATAGLYSLGFRILQIPASLLGNAISQVFVKASVQAKRNDEIADMVMNIIVFLVAFTFVPFFILAINGPQIFGFFFGEEWLQAGLYCQMLIPWAFLWFLTTPFIPIFSVFQKQEVQLYLNIINFFSKMIAIFMGVYFSSPLTTIALLGMLGFFVYGSKLVIILKISGVPLKAFNRMFLKQFRTTVPVIIMVLLMCITSIDIKIHLILLFVLSLTNASIHSSKLKALRKY